MKSKTLEQQLTDFLKNHPNKDNCISAKEFKELFLLGFAKQMQIDVEKFYDFTVIDNGNGDCIIEAKLKNNKLINCNVLNEFFLKSNISQVKQMFGVPDYAEIKPISDGTVEI